MILRSDKLKLWLVASLALFLSISSVVTAAVVVHRIGAIELVTTSSNPIASGKVGIWAKTSDGLPYIHRADNSTQAVNDFTGLALNTTVGPSSFHFGTEAWTASASNKYLRPFWASTADATEYFISVPRACLVKKFYVTTQMAPTGNGVIYTLRTSSVDTSITCTQGTGSTTCSDTTNSVVVGDGENMSLKIKGQAGITAGPGWITVGVGCTKS